jgi:hypothetical protein
MVDHFTYGPWTPGIAYAVSVIGSSLGPRQGTVGLLPMTT